jgi:PAS domain S-box-containing protein
MSGRGRMGAVPEFSVPADMGGIAVAQSPLESIDVGQTWTQSQLFTAIVCSSDVAVIGKTLEGVITCWNPAAERMYGYQAGEIIGQPMRVLCPPDRIDEAREILTKIVRGESVTLVKTVRRHKDGTTFPVSVAVSPIRDEDGRLIGAASLSRDITEQLQLGAAAALIHRAEDLQKANRSLESFTYSVSHDLRAPLRALGGFSGALLEEYGDVLGEEGRGYAERIQSASDRMAQLIDDLLGLSRVAQAELHRQTVDLGAEVSLIAEELQHAEPGRRVKFSIQRPVEAQADRMLIRTALQNLVGNAWKFTSRRDDALIEFGIMPTEDGSLCCYVRDNGAGFDSAYVHKLFIPFQRLHTISEFPGTGVGLASVRQIVERHGGQVWAEGAVGEGAAFYFTLDSKEIA